MKTIDMIQTAISNSFRGKTRTLLTVVAIVIGAFTLTLTNGFGSSINSYIDGTVASLGASNAMTVTKSTDETEHGPQPYNPDATTVQTGPKVGIIGGGSSSADLLTTVDVATLEATPGIISAEPVRQIVPDFIEGKDSTPYEVLMGGFSEGGTLQLMSGRQLDQSTTEYEVAIPRSYVDPLGLNSKSDALGSTVVIGVTDAEGRQSSVDATVAAVTEPGLAGGSTAVPNQALAAKLYSLQSVGETDDAVNTFAQATVRFNTHDTPAEIADLQDRLTDLGFGSVTVVQQIGSFKTFVDAIILVLNAFAIVALIAAGFGIVNTLLMSVQERTREIGLMKAMGMGAGRVFGLFSTEAVFIGFLGSAIGAGLAITVGYAVNGFLANGILANLPGLSLVAFPPASIVTIILVVMGLSFLAGTIPALRAARQDPIKSLRHE